MSAPRRSSVFAWTSMTVLGCVVFDVALHDFFEWAFDFDYFDNGLPHSVVVQSGLFSVAASAGFVAIFGFLAWRYLAARRTLGGPLRGGLRFFAPIAAIMFCGVLECAFAFATPFRPELLTAIADAVPFLLFGALLSRVPPATRAEDSAGARSAPWPSMLWIALCFVVGRYLVSYPLLHVVSGYVARPIGTLSWTVGCGLCMGAFYWLAGSASPAATPLRAALRAGLTLGTFWLMVQLFLAMISAVSILDLAIRGSADTVYLVAGIYGFERLFRRSAALAAGPSPQEDVPCEVTRAPRGALTRSSP